MLPYLPSRRFGSAVWYNVDYQHDLCRGKWMETGIINEASVNLIGFIAILVSLLMAAIAITWQMRSQTSRLETQIETYRKEFQEERRSQQEENKAIREKLDEESRAFREKLDEESRAFREKLDEESRASREEFREENRAIREEFREENRAIREEFREERLAQNGKISEVERQQAWQEGVNSVLSQDRHTHPPQAAGS